MCHISSGGFTATFAPLFGGSNLRFVVFLSPSFVFIFKPYLPRRAVVVCQVACTLAFSLYNYMVSKCFHRTVKEGQVTYTHKTLCHCSVSVYFFVCIVSLVIVCIVGAELFVFSTSYAIITQCKNVVLMSYDVK